MNCRPTHVHVVVGALVPSIEVPREQFKAWCTRKLRERARLLDPAAAVREHWWTERGWDEYVDDDEALREVNTYVHEGQSP